MKMLLTRPDDTTKIIITGDEEQSDRDSNGLSDLSDRLCDDEVMTNMIHMIRFQEEDAVRSEFVKLILKIYKY